MNNTTRNLFLWAAIGAILFVIFQMFPGSSTRQITPPIAYSQFMNDVTDNKVEEVTISGHNILGRTKDGRTFITYAPENPATVTKLLEKKCSYSSRPAGTRGFALSFDFALVTDSVTCRFDVLFIQANSIRR